jgi:hypothetical protein
MFDSQQHQTSSGLISPVTDAAKGPALIKVGAKFGTLRLELRLLDDLCAALRKQGFWTEQLELSWELHRERLLDEMQDIALIAIKQSAGTYAQLRVKARIFLEYCTPEGGDTPDLLGASICQDILAAPAPACGCADRDTGRDEGSSHWS